MRSVQIKICGITRPEDADFCKELEIDAIGCVFFKKSPRYVDEIQAREICSAFNGEVVGVFVNPEMKDVLKVVEKTGITSVQLHGNESEELITDLKNAGIRVIKSLFYAKEPGFSRAPISNASAFIVEHGGRGLGGTGASWNWAEASKLRRHGKPYLIAGGISPGNVVEALEASLADGVDLSSGVEKAPGVKDRSLISALKESVRLARVTWHIRDVFETKKHFRFTEEKP